MSSIEPISVIVEQEQDFSFRIRFEGTAAADLLTDEPEPLGGGQGPNPSRVLLAAIANCLAASLLFALRKFKNSPGALRAVATTQLERNEAGRWRIPRAKVSLQLGGDTGSLSQLPRVLEQFEEFCVVTQSVRQGIAVDVEVVDEQGKLLHQRTG